MISLGRVAGRCKDPPKNWFYKMLKRKILLFVISLPFVTLTAGKAGAAAQSIRAPQAADFAWSRAGGRTIALHATQDQQAAQQPSPSPRRARRATTNSGSSGTTQSAASAPGSRGVVAAFNNLLDGIRHADVARVTDVYWNAPQLTLFNYNGTVTHGWEQMRANRASSYPELKDVRLDVRDLRVQMLGPDAALVTCLWTQADTFRGTPETASGRMTIVFRRLDNKWKAIHLHTSPDAPEPSRVPASEQPRPASPPPPRTTPSPVLSRP